MMLSDLTRLVQVLGTAPKTRERGQNQNLNPISHYDGMKPFHLAVYYMSHARAHANKYMTKLTNFDCTYDKYKWHQC